ncbi:MULTISPECIES: GNAT family N-acetyltransferase [Pseudomonas]|uniref:GNAT family N-acetyltransferase n=1 Tax=Pseudomonas azadiae TaxID=2843612 RepID=A0ABS6P218_9PSED|nr:MULTISPECIES: GNAT family N-acetyltransferase [Pseudomonas]MBV4454514.1 GNAT family N-acetyltransferase [Pseudomonas azadiae]NMF39686.1 GNAT family N-acetyltransferase [Pseudomonas sp. SWRI 103]
MGLTFSPVISSGVPETARQLFWEVFFSSRGRGVDLLTHFPWMSCDENVFCVEIKSTAGSDETIAALVIKALPINQNSSVGLVGLVCVEEALRGKGFVSSLMAAATDLAVNKGLAALMLWTQKPEVYAGKGFVTDERNRFGYIEWTPDQCVKLDYTVRNWPDLSRPSEHGIPPFATGGQVISSKNATIVVLVSSGGHSIAEWSGKEEDVVDLIMCSMPGRCSLNIGEENSLISELEEKGVECNLGPAAVRMVNYLNSSASVKVPHIKFLNRI